MKKRDPYNELLELPESLIGEILNGHQISKYMALRGYKRDGHGNHHKHQHGDRS